MEQEKILQSLEDIINDISPDCLSLDTSVIGVNFLSGMTDVHINSFYGKSNNLNKNELKRYINSLKKFIEFAEEHNPVVASPVIAEFDRKVQLTRTCYHNISSNDEIGVKRNKHRHSNFQGKKQRKLERVLKEIMDLEDKTKEYLNNNLIPNYDSTQISLKLNAVRIMAERGKININGNDEEIVASSIYHGFKTRKHVAIITKDRRFKEILTSIQGYLEESNSNDSLSKFLKNEGGIKLVVGSEEGFRVEYNSSNYISPNQYRKHKQADI